MITRQRRRLDREVTDEHRPIQLVSAQLFPDFLDEFPVAPSGAGFHTNRVRDRLQFVDRRMNGHLGLAGELALQSLVQAVVHVQLRPLAAKVVGGTVGKSDDQRIRVLLRVPVVVHQLVDGARTVLDQALRRGGVIVIRRVGLIGFQHGELRAVGGVDALVPEIPIDLEDLLNTADDAALQVELRRNAQVEVHIQSVGMRHKRTRSRTAMQRLQHGSLDLEETQALEILTHSTHNGHAGDHHAAGIVPHN